MKEEERDWEGTRQAAASIIRKRSEAGCLASRQEILQELIGQNLLLAAPEEPDPNLESFLHTTLEENEDLRELLSPRGKRRYFSVQFLSETYARILLRKEGDPLDLIAEVVRDRSAKYLRPTPLDVFQGQPFGLTPEQIQSCLERMKGQAGYRDIAQIRTSVGTVYLFSASYLDPAHASMLAEWLDVGQFNNP
jgi:hypothetical protein